MLVVTFWILLIVVILSAAFLVITYFTKQRKLRKMALTTLIISILAVILNMNACIKRVKTDFGYRKSKVSLLIEKPKSLKIKLSSFDLILDNQDNIKQLF